MNKIMNFAYDRATLRRIDADGRLHVEISNISKANVCPYMGGEIPGWEGLGLEKDKIYQLFRDPEELEKAASTFNNIPILKAHVPVTVDNPQIDLIVGSTGTDSIFEAPFLKNSLVVWTADAIKKINTDEQKELSCSYRYKPDMTPGAYNGKSYDGVMRDIIGNHVALVSEGRAGSDVVVGDEALTTHEAELMAKTSKAALVQGATLVFMRPLLAADSKVDIAPIFKGLTMSNYKSKKKEIGDKLIEITKGKLAADASMGDVHKLLDSLDDEKPAEDVEDPMQGEANKMPKAGIDPVKDAGPPSALMEFLAGKLSPEDLAQVQTLCKPDVAATDEDMDEDTGLTDDEEDKEKDEKKNEKKDMKPAMDAKSVKRLVTSEVIAAVKIAEDKALKNQRDTRTAEIAIRPFVGTLAVAMDSAADVYRAAFKIMKVDVDGVHESAYPAILRSQPLPGARKTEVKVALDSAGATSYHKRFPGTENIKRI